MTVSDFQRESHRIDQLIWDAMALLRGERVLFCGFANDAAWVRRAAEIGVDVAVIESDEAMLSELSDLGLQALRGSTTMIPSRDSSFDAVVAFHYLHEIDPTFHAQIVSEIARVGRRVIVVEPAPPADPLGRRIAELYSRAKYEAGAFEEYQPIDYWRKLLAMVKADVVMQQFTFTRLAPRFAIDETVSLILEAMEIEAMPAGYLEELRELARSPDAQLSPLSRLVLVAAPAGRPIHASAGTLFRRGVEPIESVESASIAATTADTHPAAIRGAAAPGAPIPPDDGAAEPVRAAYLDEAEFPPVLPPLATVPPPVAPPSVAAPPAAETPPFGVPAPSATPAFGLPDSSPFGVPAPKVGGAPFGTPFALPDDPDPFGLDPDSPERAELGWTWEPPEDHSTTEKPFDASGPFGTKDP